MSAAPNQQNLVNAIHVAGQNNLVDVLEAYLPMLAVDPKPVQALSTWTTKCFQILMDYLDKNEYLIESIDVEAIRTYMETKYPRWDTLLAFFMSKVGAPIIDKIILDETKCSEININFLKSLKGIDVSDPTWEDDEMGCAERAILTGRTCVNPYCSECK
jgi:hypothetical protein